MFAFVAGGSGVVKPGRGRVEGEEANDVGREVERGELSRQLEAIVSGYPLEQDRSSSEAVAICPLRKQRYASGSKAVPKVQGMKIASFVLALPGIAKCR